MKVRVHIERLVLDGLPVTTAQGPLIRDALQRELANALTSGGLSHELRNGGAFPRLRTEDSKLSESNPGALGTQIARSVHGAIGRAK
jgi:hypothetical protein